MEISGNKYLHKKFKKQTSCAAYNAEETHIQIASSSFNNGQNKTDTSQKKEEREEDSATRKDLGNVMIDVSRNLDSVPNLKSTNCEYSLVNTYKDNVGNVNVVSDHRSSISVLSSANKVDFQESVLTARTVSNVISKTDTILSNSTFIGNDLKENHFSFDTKPSNTPNVTDKSSTVDIIYSKYSLLSERPNIANVVQNDESTKSYNKSDDIIVSEISEKKQNCAESTGGKYVCTYCNLACSKPSVLQKHIRAHTNERPYPCVSCGFSFKTRSNLYKHCRSRTHANRVMGNKHIQSSVEYSDVDSTSEKNDEKFENSEESDERLTRTPVEPISAVNSTSGSSNMESATIDQKWEQKSKPYKPKFHTAKLFFEENKKNEIVTINTPNLDNKKVELSNVQSRADPDLLKLRINELISKNNSIVNCDDAVVIRRKPTENGVIENIEQPVYWQQTISDYGKSDEPLNLTSKNRKRCLSDSENTQKSFIKELLLKNMSPDPNLQCQYCRMIFQTVPELEMHKLKYCSAYNKSSNVRYTRSSSVNVASILTQNKNAFDNIPHMQNNAFPLKSPGPFLGKTRLIENEKSDKYRTFSFDDNVILQHAQPESPNLSKYVINSPGYSPLSPQVKKNPVKLFGGEVKITQTSGETRSFKIESETTLSKISGEPSNYVDYGTKLSENLVIKSSLQSGGTVLQSKLSYPQKVASLPSPNILRYDNTNIVSPNLNLSVLNENKFTYDKMQGQPDRLLAVASPSTKNSSIGESSYAESTNTKTFDKEKDLYKSNLIDFSQKAIKLITPNLKPPNLSIPGLPVPAMNDKIYSPMDNDKEKQYLDNINFAKKQISLQQKMDEVPPSNIYNPVNLLVNGKVVRYVPGMPGPVAEAPMEFTNMVKPISKMSLPKESLKSPRPSEEIRDQKDFYKSSTSTIATITTTSNTTRPENKMPTIVIDQHDTRQDIKTQVLSKIKSDYERKKELEKNEINKSLENKPPLSVAVSEKTSKEEPKKFARPNSLALKPSSGVFKTHHGLTPTMFNQALISPDTPRVAKKFCQQYLNGNYFSYLGLKSSTKSVYCTLNKTQPFYVKHFKKLSMYSEWRQQESKIDSLSVSAYDSTQRQTRFTLAGASKADLIVHSSYKVSISFLIVALQSVQSF